MACWFIEKKAPMSDLYRESSEAGTIPPQIQDLALSLRDPSSLSLTAGDETSLANGLTGIVLLPLTLTSLFPEQQWGEVAGAYFAHIAEVSRRNPVTQPGLYHGSCGIAFSLELLARQDARYHNASNAFLCHFIQQVTSWDWRDHPFLLGQENFEVVGGAAGILRFLLTLPPEAGISSAQEQLFSYLIWVSLERERWCHRPARLGPIAKAQYPQGYIDLGLAHGIAGPLAALSLALLGGQTSPEAREAVERWATWLVEQRLDMPWGSDWPAVIPRQLRAQDCPPARSGWCYGTPGIARAIWLAGRALADESLCALAREALASALRRQHNIDQPQLCHGIAGLLLICLHFAHDDAAGCAPWLEEALPSLRAKVAQRWQESYGHMEPGLLTGAVGGALTLIASFLDQDPLWSQLLMLA